MTGRDVHPSKRLLIGLGTGRCGTVSLAALLNLQNDSAVMHEAGNEDFEYNHKWLGYDDAKMCVRGSSKRRNLVRYLNAFPGDGKFIGDVGYYYLPYVPIIAEVCSSVKFVCLWRNKREAVESLVHQAERTNRNPWQNHSGARWFKAGTYPCWPKFDSAATRGDACAAYYDFYYEESRKYEKMFPDKFQIFQMDALNNAHGVGRILDFCGFLRPIIAAGIHKNRRLL